MAGTKISAMTDGTAAAATDVFPIARSGANFKLSITELFLFLAPITNSLSGDVALNNTANFFDGPSVAQGTAGTWFVSGTVTVLDTSPAAIYAKLWDGTTVIASARTYISTAGQDISITLSGFLATPAGNLRISVRDVTNTSGNIKFNDTGLSKDSTISAYRIG